MLNIKEELTYYRQNKKLIKITDKRHFNFISNNQEEANLTRQNRQLTL